MIAFSCNKLIYKSQTSPVTQLLKILQKQLSKEGTANRNHSPSSLQSAAKIIETIQKNFLCYCEDQA